MGRAGEGLEAPFRIRAGGEERGGGCPMAGPAPALLPPLPPRPDPAVPSGDQRGAVRVGKGSSGCSSCCSHHLPSSPVLCGCYFLPGIMGS